MTQVLLAKLNQLSGLFVVPGCTVSARGLKGLGVGVRIGLASKEERICSSSEDVREDRAVSSVVPSVTIPSRGKLIIKGPPISPRKVTSAMQTNQDASNTCSFGFHPELWANTYPVAVNGVRQSPIDICTSQCTKCPCTESNALTITYPDSLTDLSIKNTGHGWVVNIPPEQARNTSLSGGPLSHKYTLEQFHCHWGSDCSCGSEHTVDGKSYAAELHLVHWNSEKFPSFAEAAASDTGLAVVGVFLDIGAEANPEFEKITARMKDIKYKNAIAPLNSPLSLQALVPADKSYWFYEGSLTTPPLYESVSWLVLKNPIQVSESQVAQFREICFHDESERPPEGDVKVTANFRPPQPLRERVVSFVG